VAQILQNFNAACGTQTFRRVKKITSLKSALFFLTFTLRMLIVFKDVSGQPIGSIFKGQESLLGP